MQSTNRLGYSRRYARFALVLVAALLVGCFAPDREALVDGGIIAGGGSQIFKAPFAGDAVLYLPVATKN